MATENKTKQTDASVDAYIASRAKGQQAADCTALMSMLCKLTKQPPKMWGPSIVGFGSYRYKYESGRTGEAPLAGFAIRGREIVLYLDCEGSERKLLDRLGKHRLSKACLYFKTLEDLDTAVLERIAADAIAATQRKYPQ